MNKKKNGAKSETSGSASIFLKKYKKYKNSVKSLQNSRHI